MVNKIYSELLEVAERKGIEIMDNSMNIKGIDGLYIGDSKGDVIALNVKLADDPIKRNFVLAHELGHQALHRGNGDMIENHSSIYETQADNYAYDLIESIKGELQ